MNSIIDLLNEKNQHLEKFFRLNEAQLENLTCSNFNGLDAFYAQREGVLAIINKIDEMIERSNEIPLDSVDIDNAIKNEILTALNYKSELVSRILEQDLHILSAIEKEKSGIIKELTQVRAAKKAIGSYKSGGTSSRLDEEA
jgi:hypothetical protein